MTDPSADRPAVLLVHGTGSTVEHNYASSGWPDLLADAGRTVVGVHLPGHGPDPAAPEDDPAAAVLAAADLDPGRGSVDAVGFSAGARAVLAAVVARPELFRRVALLGMGDSSVFGQAIDIDPDDTGQPLPEAISAALTGVGPAEGVPLIFARMVRSAGNDPELVARFLTAERSPLTEEQVAAVGLPVLLVLGEDDFARPADRLAAVLPQSETVIVRRVDHFGLTSDFGCLDAVLDFLQD